MFRYNPPFHVPRNLTCMLTDGRAEWLQRLPTVIDQVARTWSLLLGAPFEPGGTTAWVAPAWRDRETPMILKVAFRHPEADHEAEGLRVWNGDGAVRCFEVADYDDTVAMLLERCVPGTLLNELPDTEQDVVICELLRRLWREPPIGHPFRPLAEMCTAWADQFEQKAESRPPALDAGVVQAGIALFRSLPTTAERDVLLVTDLHAENVLVAEREPWLVIDPKPYVGDPTYDALQHMLNCEGRLQSDPLGLVKRMARLLDLDEDRLRSWLFARCVQESIDWPELAPVAATIAA
jgi:streptomycin 6-kinase